MRNNGVMRYRAALILSVAVGSAVPPGMAWSDPAPLVTYIVSFAEPPAEDDLAMLRGAARDPYGFQHVPAAVVLAAPADLPLLRSLPGVLGVYANESYAPLLSSATTTSRATEAWDLGWTGIGVSVAVIDAGVDGTHADLCAAPQFCQGTPVKTIQNVKVLGRQDYAEAAGVVYLENQLNTDSTSGHGSHVAGIAAGNGAASAGRYRGVAPGASLVAYGTGEAVEAVNVLGAYDHAIAHRDLYGIRVINNSWGPGAFTDYDPDHPVNRATDAAWAAGISVVFGSGNDGTRTDSLNMFSAHPKAISAAGGRKDGHQAFFSSRGIPGSPLWRPTVMAPGENVVSVRASTGFTIHAADAGAGYANPDAPPAELAPYYASSSGTSMAAPHVSGVIALMQQAARATRGVWLTPQQVRNVLQNTARSMTPVYQHHETGAGYVDAYEAVRAAAAGTKTGPWDDGTHYDLRLFSGTVTANGGGFEAEYDVLPGARSLSVMADWGPEKVLVANQDVDIELVRPDGTPYLGTFLRCDPAGQPNGYSSFCSSSPNERIVAALPVPGRWKVRVSGLLNASETVHGMWSAAYPDGTPVPTPVAPVAVTVAAPAVAVVGRPAELTATVTDATDTPVPNAKVTWSTAGTISHAETYADSRGRVVATLDSLAPGRQTVTATVGAITGTAVVDWQGATPPSLVEADTPGSASGGGLWLDGSVLKLVALSAEYREGATSPGGRLSYHDSAGRRATAESVDRFVIDGGTATFSGAATFDGEAGYRYEATVTDGSSDTVRLVVTRLLFRWETAGTIRWGHLRVRAD